MEEGRQNRALLKARLVLFGLVSLMSLGFLVNWVCLGIQGSPLTLITFWVGSLDSAGFYINRPGPQTRG